VVFNQFRGFSWWEYYDTSTGFIEFMGYPFIQFFGFSYEAMMVLFSWFGLLGFYFFYIVLNERVQYTHTFMGYDLVVLLLFLPNLHYWSASFGKGSIIFLGFGLYFYALNRVGQRLIPLVLGSLIIYHVRPHIFLVVAMASAWGFVFSTRGISWTLRFFVILLSIGAISLVYDDVIKLTGIDEENVVGNVMSMDLRTTDLMKAGSGVDITQYNIFMKLFTFWFRPLFVDSHNFMSFVVSFENVFYLIIFSYIVRNDFLRFFQGSDHVVKAAFISFIGVSFVMAQLCANLGLAIRQKSQVMPLMLFVILKYLDNKRYDEEQLKERRKRIEENRAVARRQRMQARDESLTGASI
ncbi:MAG: hypothetical protein ACKOYP_00825, partial [Bacteroidota bacterium]